MKRRIALFGLGLSLLLVPAEAMAALCLNVCNQYAPCDRVCREYGGGPFTTCGEWGDCQSGACTPNWQPVSSQTLGAFQANYYSPFYCEHVVVERVTWHDVYNCPGSSDRTSCHYYVNASQPDHFCCYTYWCGGQTSC